MAPMDIALEPRVILQSDLYFQISDSQSRDSQKNFDVYAGSGNDY